MSLNTKLICNDMLAEECTLVAGCVATSDTKPTFDKRSSAIVKLFAFALGVMEVMERSFSVNVNGSSFPLLDSGLGKVKESPFCM